MKTIVTFLSAIFFLFSCGEHIQQKSNTDSEVKRQKATFMPNYSSMTDDPVEGQCIIKIRTAESSCIHRYEGIKDLYSQCVRRELCKSRYLNRYKKTCLKNPTRSDGSVAGIYVIPLPAEIRISCQNRYRNLFLD